MRQRSPARTITRVDIDSRIGIQQLDGVKAIVLTGDRKGCPTVLVGGPGIYTAIEEKVEHGHIKRYDGVVQYSTPSNKFKCTMVYKTTNHGSVPVRSSKVDSTLGCLLIPECTHATDQTRVQEACEAFVRTQEGVLVARLLHVRNVEEYLVRKIKDVCHYESDLSRFHTRSLCELGLCYR